MALSPKLEVRQSQSLVMTPQLMQAIKLLQMSNLDLTSYVETELERNPLLERSDPEAPVAEDAQAGHDDEGGKDAVDDNDWMQSSLEVRAEDIAARMDTDLGNVFPDEAASRTEPDPASLRTDSWQSGGSGGGGIAGEDYNLEAFVASQETLFEHLAEQLALAVHDPVDRVIGQHLIDSLDATGYLRADLDEIAERLGVSRHRLDAVLAILQTFEPTGVFATSLKECLALQLREKNRLDPAMAALLENMELLARHDYAALRRLCGIDDEDLADMVAELKALDPKPGSRFGSETIQPVVPDVFVQRAADGGWAIELNSDTLPKVLINQGYYARVSRTTRNETEKAYLTDCLQTANWLVKSLDQRARTILKVSSEIVRQQDAFLTHGIQYLRPLNLRTIADAIGMHESTISRVTSNKYMATPRGIFELKYFFTAAISSAEGGEAHSAEAVRHRIRQMIDAESPDDILSDDTIVKELKGEGIDIARRTVAKYRESMRISSSVQRRREKRAQAARS
ncbi:RNA polymerase factor sigma-54 [Stappia sp. F7233]|uniref:RNA polymerase sigma-54 factor n=1 Tax=Stappia albiluteola TaxID=2758565 RepID=A0A839ACZ6_9HYPH|nr:RNA polymerase factor sigma-54 [Stappia albiluteola]MBA5777016.1 RNA polymerase factor sigma-54 [Stappia albiluteola]